MKIVQRAQVRSGGDCVLLPAEHLNLLLEELVGGWPREAGSEFKLPSVFFSLP